MQVLTTNEDSIFVENIHKVSSQSFKHMGVYGCMVFDCVCVCVCRNVGAWVDGCARVRICACLCVRMCVWCVGEWVCPCAYLCSVCTHVMMMFITIIARD